MLPDMSFEVELANEAPIFGGDEDEYEFLPNGVLVVTFKNLVRYYAPGHWLSVKTPGTTAARGSAPHPPKGLGSAPFTPPIGD
jgi:hypothetical protein